MPSDGLVGQLMPQHKCTTWATNKACHRCTDNTSNTDRQDIRHNGTSPRERELTSCGDQVPVWNEEFIPIMLLEDIRKDLQGKMLFLSGFLAPLVGVHFSVGQVSIIVLVICEQTRIKTGEILLLLHRRHRSVTRNLMALSFVSLLSLSSRCR